MPAGFGGRASEGGAETRHARPADIYSLTGQVVFVSSKGTSSSPKRLTSAEQEVQSAAERLAAQIDDALAAVSITSPDGSDELDATADRLERAARDLSVALRELAEERKHREAE